MGTRSDIIVKLANGQWKRIYCHWDGYLSHNGKILFEHYNSQKKAEALVKHGDLSSLDEKCSKPHGHSFDFRVNGYCVYYGRDRGEKNTEGHTGASLESVWPSADTWTEFTYIWDGEKWFVSDPDNKANVFPLNAALEAAEAGGSPIKSFIKSPLGTLGKRT